jgi:hypothetical protein
MIAPMEHHATPNRPYEPPTLKPMGTLHDLTLRVKSINPPSDGDFLTTGQALRTS